MSKNRFVMVLPNTVELNASADSFPVERIQGQFLDLNFEQLFRFAFVLLKNIVKIE